MKLLLTFFLLLSISSNQMLSMEEPTHKCRKKNRVYIIEPPIPASVLLPKSLQLAKTAQARITPQMPTISYKSFCKIESGTRQHNTPTHSYSAIPTHPQKKVRFNQDHLEAWNNYLKKYECCDKFTDRHSSEFKLHILQNHHELYDYHFCQRNCDPFKKNKCCQKVEQHLS